MQEQLFYKSVKNTNGAQEKGYAAVKKISGIKRHLAVDTQGLPYAFAVTPVNITDRTGALPALKQNWEIQRLCRLVKTLLENAFPNKAVPHSVFCKFAISKLR